MRSDLDVKLFAVLLGPAMVAFLAYSVDRLATSPAVGTEQWTSGTIVGLTGGALAGVGWIWRAARRPGEGLVPWQWFTMALLAVSTVGPYAEPGARRGVSTPLRPVVSFETAAMTSYTIAALLSMALVAGAAAHHRRAREAGRLEREPRVRESRRPSKHKKSQRRR